MSTAAKSAKSMHFWQIPWLGALLFLLFCLAFKIVPILILIKNSFTDKKDAWTLASYHAMSAPLYARSFRHSIKLSVVTAVLGAILRLLSGYAIYHLPSQRLHEALLALSDVTANFAGALLAFAFVVVLGSSGAIQHILNFERDGDLARRAYWVRESYCKLRNAS